MNSAEVLIKFKGDATDLDKTEKTVETSLGKLTKSFTVASLASKAISKGVQIFTSNLDSAIKRVDTMNNFPKVMSNLGISTEESTKAIEYLSEKLKGIPTTLDAAALSVQRFTSKNGDVKKSADLFLAVNNAILAGGAAPEIQASALEQLSQAYAKGKPDMMEWRSIQTAMPAQLKQVAKAMGYADTATLGAAVRAKGGEKEFSRMMDTMMKMNTEGVAGFKSFDEQARNATGGVQTSITNMKTAFVRGIGEMIKQVDKSLEPFGGLSGVITKVGQNGEKAFKKIGSVLTVVIPKLIEFGNWVNKNQDWLVPLVATIGSFVAATSAINKVKGIILGVEVALGLLKTTLLAMSTSVLGIVAIIAGLVLLYNKCEWFRNFVNGMIKGIVAVVKGSISGIVGIATKVFKTIEKVVSSTVKTLKKIWSAFSKSIGTIFNRIKTIVVNVVNGIKTVLLTVANWINTNVIQPLMVFINPLIDFIQNCLILIIALVATALEIIYKQVISIVSWILTNVINPIINLIKSMVETIGNAIKGIINFFSSVFNKIKNIIQTVFDFIVKNIVSPVITYFVTGFTTIYNFISSVLNKVKSIFTTIFNFIKNNVISPVASFFKTVFDKIYSTISGIINKAKDIFTKFGDKVKSIFTKVKDSVVHIFSSVGQVIKTPINSIIDGINKVIKSINKLKIPDWVPKIGGKSPNFKTIPKLATGTNYVPEDTLAMIHKGEAVIPKKFNPYTNMNSSMLGIMNNSGQKQVINVYASFKQDTLGQTVRDIKTFSGGARNDYNYGASI